VLNQVLGYAVHFIMVADSAAYVTMLVLGRLMHRYVRQNLAKHVSSNHQRRTLSIQRRLTRVLIIQAWHASFKLLQYQNK
jgi:mannose/fructose/N-acetylgalactosamine-specific phosphotransferase system component IID